MKRFLLPFLFVIPLLSFAQSNFQKGYVVTSSKGVIHGYIDYKGLDINPKTFSFRSELKGDTQVFNVQNSKGIGINEKHTYQVFLVDITTGNIQLEDLSTKPDLNFRRDTVFLKVLQTGKNITLYSYKDQVKLRFYIKEKDVNEPVELSRQMYLQDNNVVYTGDGYHKQLLAAFRKFNPSKEYMLSRLLKYDEKELIEAIAVINDQDLTKLKYPAFRFFAGVALNATKAGSNGNEPLSNDAAVSKRFYLPAITAGADFFDNRVTQKIIYRAELSLLMARNLISTTTSDVAFAAVSRSFDQYIVALSPQVIYNVYNKEKIKVFIGLGGTLNYSYYSKDLYSVYNSFRNKTAVEEDRGDLQHLYFSVPAAVGVTINKKIELSLSYGLKADITDHKNNGLNTQRTRIGVNYLFGK